jgi:hypothetical protein
METNTPTLKPAGELFDKIRFKYAPLVDAERLIDKTIKYSGTRGKIRMLLGESGTSKSTLIEILENKYPPIDNIKFAFPMPQILSVEAASGATPKVIYKTLLRKLHINPTGDTSDLEEQLVYVLKKSPVRLIVIDEIQHVLPHTHTAVATQKIADSLKKLLDTTNISMLLVGLDTAKSLMNNTYAVRTRRIDKEIKQLPRRSHRTIFMSPVEYGNKALFEVMMNGYTNAFNRVKEEHNISIINLLDKEVQEYMWAATQGFIGHMNSLFMEAIECVEENGQIQMSHLAEAFDDVAEWDKSGLNPFLLNRVELSQFIADIVNPKKTYLKTNKKGGAKK